MPLTDNDLRAVLAERASAAPGHDAVARVASVDRRVRVIRRRRAASASLAVVMLLLVVTGVSGLFRGSRDRTAPVPAHLQKVADGLLPRYNGGGKATAYTSFRTDEKRSTTFTFTPGSPGLLVAIRCDKDMPESQMVSIDVNGRPLMAGSCNRGLNTRGPSYGQPEADSFGIRAGEPASMRVRVVDVGSGATTPEKQPVYRGAMGNYRIAVAVYSPMAVDDYPFPPRPRKLASLDAVAGGRTGRVLGTVDSRSVGANGEGAVITKLTRKGFHTEIFAVAPGAITVTVNTRPIDVAANWTWTESGFGGLTMTAAKLRKLGIDVKTGDRVSVAFAGSRFAVAGWRAEVREGP
jgi:hypothetical protein